MKELNWILIDIKKENWPKNGAMISVKAGQKKYCLGKFKDVFFLVNSKCPHAGGILSDGKINEKGQIICPNHRYVFDPHTGKNVSGEGFYCEHYSIKEENDNLYIAQKKSKLFWTLFGFN